MKGRKPPFHTTSPMVVSLLVVGIALLGWFRDTAAQSTTLVVTGVTLIDGTGASPRSNADVLVKGDRIALVGSARGVRVPSNAVTL